MTTEMIKRISISSEQLKHYRSTPKRVGLNLTLTVILHDDVAFCRHCKESNVRHIWDPVFAGLLHIKRHGWRSNSHWGPCDVHGKSAPIVSSINMEFFIPADKPKLILSESKAMALISRNASDNDGKGIFSFSPLQEVISQRIKKVIDKHEEDDKEHRIAEQANRLIEHIAEEARTATMSLTKFEEKLQALKDVFKLEQEKCLEDLIKNELDDMCQSSKEAWDPRAIELVREKASGALDDPIRLFMSRHIYKVVQVEDVHPVTEEIKEVLTT